MVDLIEFPSIASKLSSFACQGRQVKVKHNDHPLTYNRGSLTFAKGEGRYFVKEAGFYFQERNVVAIVDQTTIIISEKG
jgi:hypothetical protein